MPAEDALLRRPGDDFGVAAHASTELLDTRGFPHGPSGLYTSHAPASYALHNLQGDAPIGFNTRQDNHTYQQVIGVQHHQLQESSHYAPPINNAANPFDLTFNFPRASFGDSNTSDLSSQPAQSVRHVAGYSFSNVSAPDMISDDINSIGYSQLSGSPAVPFADAPQAGFSNLPARRNIRNQAGARVVQGFAQELQTAHTSSPVAGDHTPGSDYSAAPWTGSASGMAFAPPPSVSAWSASPMPGVMQSMSPIGGMGQMNGMPFTGMGGWSMNLSQSMPVQPLPGAHSNFVQAHQRVMGQQTYQEEMAALSDGWERLFKADDSGNGYGNTGCGGGGGSDGGVYDGSAYGGGGPRFTPTTFPSSGAHGGLMDMSRPGATATSRYSPQDDPAVYEGLGDFDTHAAYGAHPQEAFHDSPVLMPDGHEHALSALVAGVSGATLDHAPPWYTSNPSPTSFYDNSQQAMATQQVATYDTCAPINAHPGVDDALASNITFNALATSQLEPRLNSPSALQQAVGQLAVLGQDRHAVTHYAQPGAGATSMQEAPTPALATPSSVPTVVQPSQGAGDIQRTGSCTDVVPTRFSCPVCLSSFKYRRSRNKHHKGCKESGPSFCGDCNLMWSSPEDRMKHIPLCASEWVIQR